jgi:polar amino acid transport system permease protein
MAGFADTFLNVPVIVRSLPAVAAGFVLTVELAVLVVATGLAAGLLLAVVRTFGIRPLNWLIIFLVDLFRALPPLVIILLLYFGAPAFGATPSGFLCTWISLSLVLMAFAEEIYWAGITAVPRGQWEAARATGLGFAAALRHVVLPQALRITVPPLTNRTIAITKGTALGSVVAVSEILSQASSAMSFSGNPSPLLLGAAAYLVLFLPMVAAGRWVERRWRQHPAR